LRSFGEFVQLFMRPKFSDSIILAVMVWLHFKVELRGS
jgi:hypothetical protein